MTADPPACPSDPIAVATTYATAVQEGDLEVQHACESTQHPPASDRVEGLRNFGQLLFAQATDVTRSTSAERTIDIPGPPIPNIATGGGTTLVMVPHLCGVIITVVSDGVTGGRVTDVSFYCSG